MIEVLPRTFTYNSLTLDDPDPRMTPDEVKDFYAEVYPESHASRDRGTRTVGDRR